jgi:hypothetical protein
VSSSQVVELETTAPQEVGRVGATRSFLADVRAHPVQSSDADAIDDRVGERLDPEPPLAGHREEPASADVQVAHDVAPFGIGVETCRERR